MARIRTIKPEFWQDEKLALLPPLARLVFLGLVSQADDAGRLVDNVKLLDGLLFPYTDDSCADALADLAAMGRIARYRSASGQALIQVANWDKHQKVVNPSKYNLPGPPEVKGSETKPTPSIDPIENLNRVSASYRLPSTSDLQPTTADPREGRVDALAEMQDEVNTFALTVEDRTKRKAFSAEARLIVMGDDASAWHDQAGTPIPWADRPRLLRLALPRLAAGESDKLRGALRWVISQQYDPLPLPTAAEVQSRRRPEGNATPAVAPKLPSIDESRRKDAEDAERERRQKEADNARIGEWEAVNQLDAKRLRKEAEDEVARNQFVLPHLRAGMVDYDYRRRVLAVLAPTPTRGAA